MSISVSETPALGLHESRSTKWTEKINPLPDNNQY